MGRMQIVYRSIKDILPYEKNPRINDEAVPVVKESIKEFGFRIPSKRTGTEIFPDAGR